MTESLLEIRDLDVVYESKGFRRSKFHALHDVNLDVRPGETVGLVGESGSGKSTIGRAVLGLVPVASGMISYAGQDITHAKRKQRRALASEIQAVFQDPYNSLNPSMSIGETLAEPLSIANLSRKAALQRVKQALDKVHLPSDSIDRRPHEFSGGQRQRIAIARALVLDPRLIVCDEPLSALDLATQSRIVDLLIELQESSGVAYLFISHDLHLVKHLCHRVTVLERGRVIESGNTRDVTVNPQQEYTRLLLEASPIPDPRVQKARVSAK